MNLNPKICGPHYWFCIHNSARNYGKTTSDPVYYKAFITSLTKVFPCHKCKSHMSQLLKELPDMTQYVNTNEQLFHWSYLLHSKCNSYAPNKKDISYEEALELYKVDSQEEIDDDDHFWFCIHASAANYTPENLKEYKAFFRSLTKMSPKHHELLSKIVSEIPMSNDYTKNNETLFRWTYLVHQEYNKWAGKQTPSYPELRVMFGFNV